MSKDKYHYCPYCNYKWRHGEHGGHSCTERLVKQRDALLAMLKEGLPLAVGMGWKEQAQLLIDEIEGK